MKAPKKNHAKKNETKNARGRTKSRNAAKQTGLIDILIAQHRSIEGLFAEFKDAEEARKEELAERIAGDLAATLLAEEELLLPQTKEPDVPSDLLDEAAVDHDIARIITAGIANAGPRDRFFDARISVLAKHMRRHFRDEEKAGGIFGKAKGLGLDLEAMGKRFQDEEEEFRHQAETETRNPMLRALRLPGSIAQPDKPEEYEMARQTEMPGRDDRGRFMSDDEDERGRGGRSSRERGYSSRSRRDDDDDDRGGRGRGGWFGDPEGHSEAARERSSSRRRDDDDDDYQSSRGGRSRRMRDDDDNGRGQGRSGWFGDSEGHSEASRRGWDNPDHGRSGWYGDSRGHSEASRRGWDNPDHGPSGWYGDSEGHSEASRRGWEERGGSRSRGGRYEDDDDRSYRSRSRDYDDDDRRSGGGRGRGRGGWSGDSEGHSEASRRGWEDRRR